MNLVAIIFHDACIQKLYNYIVSLFTSFRIVFEFIYHRYLVRHDLASPYTLFWEMIIEQAEVGHDMSTVGWEHLVAWLDYQVNDDYSAFSTLIDAHEDSEISFSEKDFSTSPSDIL